MMTRNTGETGRNIYFVSESLKQIVTLNQDRIKVSDRRQSGDILLNLVLLVYQHGRSFTGPNRPS